MSYFCVIQECFLKLHDTKYDCNSFWWAWTLDWNCFMVLTTCSLWFIHLTQQLVGKAETDKCHLFYSSPNDDITVLQRVSFSDVWGVFKKFMAWQWRSRHTETIIECMRILHVIVITIIIRFIIERTWVERVLRILYQYKCCS